MNLARENEPETYREPSPPKARVFPLQLGGVAGRAYLTTVLSLGLAIALYVLTKGRGIVVLFAPFLGPAVAWLFAGGIRAIEVHVDRVVVRARLRPARTFAAAELMVQVLPEELFLVGPGTTIAIDRDHFPEGTFDECVDALREVASRVVERTAHGRVDTTR